MGTCPTCGEGGEYYGGPTALAEFWHFISRIIWAAHRARQAADSEELQFRHASHILSKLVDDLEAIQRSDEDTEPDHH